MYEPPTDIFFLPQYKLARLINNKAAEEAFTAKRSDHAPQPVNFEAMTAGVLEAADGLYEEMRLQLAAAAASATTVEDLWANLAMLFQHNENSNADS